MPRPLPDILKGQAQRHLDSIMNEEPRWEDQPFVQITLKRLREGNEKIWDRWEWLAKTDLTAENRHKYLEAWDRAVATVMTLGDQLAMVGYDRCIYGAAAHSFEDCPKQKQGRVCFSCLVQLSPETV